jgi:hypothetical protein
MTSQIRSASELEIDEMMTTVVRHEERVFALDPRPEGYVI